MKCDTIPDVEKFLKIQEQALGDRAPEVAATASKLADLYFKIGRLEKAEALYRRALDIREALVGVHGDEVEETRMSLERVLSARKQPTQTGGAPSTKPALNAEPVLVAAGEAAQDLGDASLNFGQADEKVRRPQLSANAIKTINDAIKELETELELLRQMVGVDHPSVADLLTKLADLYCRLKLYAQMEPVLIEALKIREVSVGSDHPSVSTELRNLARLYFAQERYAQAEPLFKRALTIREKVYGKMHPRVADIEEQYAQLMRKTNRVHQAEALEKHVNEIRTQQTPPGPAPRNSNVVR